ncbi:MAG: phosphatase PAP2 family protein [Candidatus Cloacimonetes bacterium]|nr:phosphatase PAP2 family protein [Candidatus Cloacimonadota bacterium]
MKRFSLIIITFLVLSSMLWAEEQPSYAYKYLASYPQTARQAITAPLSWQGGDWLKAGAVVLSAGALYLADEDIQHYSQNSRNDGTDRLMNIASNFGEYRIVAPALGIGILGAYLQNDKKALDTGLLSMKSFVLSSVICQGLKLATQRNRPSEGLGKKFWQESKISFDNDSFPSGHSTVVWSIAPILADQYQESNWIPPVSYGIATLTSLSRIYNDEHWASDVLAGAAIGYFSAKLVSTSTPRLILAINPAIHRAGFSYKF